jgi:hypothetical protein
MKATIALLVLGSRLRDRTRRGHADAASDGWELAFGPPNELSHDLLMGAGWPNRRRPRFSARWRVSTCPAHAVC